MGAGRMGRPGWAGQPRPPERLGTAWLAVKKGVAQGKMDDLTFAMLDKVDGDAFRDCAVRCSERSAEHRTPR